MPDEAKAALRRVAQIARRAAYDGDAQTAALVLCHHGLHALAGWTGGIVAGYWPMRSEMDVRPLLLALIARGAEAALPQVPGAGQPLRFRRWRPDQVLASGPFGTAEPAADQPELSPDLLLVPLLAFDRQRHRLGYGGGFYDRTLAQLRAAKPILAVGIGFAAQEMADLPVDPWDEPLDLVLTEQGII